MTRLIDAEICIEKIKNLSIEYDAETVQRCIEVLSNAPTVDVSTVDTKPHWIPVSEKLPDALDRVLVTSTHGHVYISYIVHGEFEYGGEVIAWMPLPKP